MKKVLGLLCASIFLLSAFFSFGCGGGECKHEYNYTTIRLENCTQEGEKEGICALCGHKVYEAIPTDDSIHDYQYITLTEATCTESGYKLGACTLCEKTQVVEIAPTHKYAQVDSDLSNVQILSAPTCTTVGYAKRFCLLCSESEVITLNKLSHSYSSGICTLCGEPANDKLYPSSANVSISFAYINEEILSKNLIIPQQVKLHIRGSFLHVNAKVSNVNYTFPKKIDKVDFYLEDAILDNIFAFNLVDDTIEFIYTTGSTRTFSCDNLYAFAINEQNELYLVYNTFVAYSLGKLQTAPSNIDDSTLIYRTFDNLSYEVCGAMNEDIQHVVVPKTHNGLPVTSIKATAFKNNTNILSVELGENVKHLGASCFYGCTNLEKVTLTNSVDTIDMLAFNKCDKLSNVFFYGSEAQKSEMVISDLGNKLFINAIWNYL